MIYRNLTILLFFIIFISGCSQLQIEDAVICQCDSDLSFLDTPAKTVPFSIRGDCRLVFYDGDKKIDETYTVKMFFDPTSNLYFQADHLLLGKAIIAGGNDEQFWLWIRHKEVSSYWYGNWDKGHLSSTANLAVNPSAILETMGLFIPLRVRNSRVENRNDLSKYWLPADKTGKLNRNQYNCDLSGSDVQMQDGFYVIAKPTVDGRLKKSYIDCCDKKLRRIEYLDSNGQISQLCVMKEYFSPADCDFLLPGRIEFFTYSNDKETASVKIDWKESSFKKKEYSQKFKDKFFTRPEPKNTLHIYKITD